MGTAPQILEQKCLAELCCRSGERCNVLSFGQGLALSRINVFQCSGTSGV